MTRRLPLLAILLSVGFAGCTGSIAQAQGEANLDKVPPKGALIVVTWPKVQKGLGFPARAFAILP
jgi:kynurenine formamidase